MTLPQHGQASSGSRYSVTTFVISTSQTCDHHVPARTTPCRPAPHREHSAGGGSSSRLPGSGPRDSPDPACPGWPPRWQSSRRSRSEECRALRSALRRSRAPIGSFDGGVPGVRAIRRQPAFQLSDRQLQPPVPLPQYLQLRPEHRILCLLRLDHGPQPGKQFTLLPAISRQPRRIGHKPGSRSTSTRAASATHDVSRHALTSGPEWALDHAGTTSAHASLAMPRLSSAGSEWLLPY
jgi:hypothetical protein